MQLTQPDTISMPYLSIAKQEALNTNLTSHNTKKKLLQSWQLLKQLCSVQIFGSLQEDLNL